MVRQEFPEAQLIANSRNVGFSRANNQALQASQGRYILWLNPDTVVPLRALPAMIAYMDAYPRVGILSPRLLNRDGTLQQQCRRGFPTLWNTFCYFTGLARLFPHSPRFGGYLLTYLDEEQAHEVDAVSGSCLLARREIVADIGLLDEDYFLYGSDLDWCLRAQQAGWSVVYYPGAEVIHYGGQGGTTANLYLAIYEFHHAMWLFYKKHYAARYPRIVTWLVGAVIVLKQGVSVAQNLFRRHKAAGSRKP
jgi:GT2 family glycosyltransferase